MSTQSIRREKIALLLMKSSAPVAGKDLSRMFDVSRQVIVADIAALKAEGHDILSTHSGYVLGGACRAERVFKLRHTSAQTQDELTTIVSLGGVVRMSDHSLRALPCSHGHHPPRHPYALRGCPL